MSDCPKCGSGNSKFLTVHEYKDGRTTDLKCRDCGKYYSSDEYDEGD